MYAQLRSVAPPAAILGGVLWAVFPTLVTVSPSVFPIGFLAPILLSIGVIGVHLDYRSVEKAFYEEIAVGLLGGGFLATLIGLSLYSPGETGFGMAVIISLPAIALLVGGSALLGIATTSAKTLPKWCSIPLIVAFPLDFVLYMGLSASIGVSFGVYGLLWVVIGVSLREA